jgi:tetratricopeptide (TPR) repeat protein
LERTAENFNPEKDDATARSETIYAETAARLIDTYLTLKSPEELKQALQLSTRLIALESLSAESRDRAYLQRAQLLQALDRDQEANAALDSISDTTSLSNGTIVFSAERLMTKHEYERALETLEPVANDMGLERKFPRRASYLMGVCAEQLGRADEAITYYERTARHFSDTHEGLAANLRAADLLRRKTWHEEALRAYNHALRMVNDSKDFRNQWVSLGEFRQRIETAWNEWVAGGEYQLAIDMSRMMTPLMPEVRALEFTARANHRWAEALEKQYEQETFTQQRQSDADLTERWRLSASAYEKLAGALITSSQYAEVLWVSAEHYQKGHDYENALKQINTFIDTQPKNLLPLAYVRRGRVLMDLHRSPSDLENALKDFQRVLELYDTDPAFFEAQYVIASCYVELGRFDLAEESWRRIRRSDKLEPAAEEWRLALFSLGRHLYLRGDSFWADYAADPSEKSLDDAENLLPTAFEAWDESIVLLDEYLKRYPVSKQSPEARYLLAKAYQRSAELPRMKLDEAETENAQIELRKTMWDLLRQAIREFRTLQTSLGPLAVKDRLDELGQRMLSNCYFEIAHNYYALEQYEAANTAYGQAVHKYPQDPRILLAFMQKSNCYLRLGSEIEARSMLEQAKVTLRQLWGRDEETELAEQTGLTSQEWDRWIDWMRERFQSQQQVTAGGR